VTPERRGDRLLDHDVDAARGAIDGDVAMKMRGCGDGDGVDALLQQRFGVLESGAAEPLRHFIATLAIGIGDADQFHPRHFGQHAGMIAAHHAHAHNAYAQRPVITRSSHTHDRKAP
jgi:hypothetical protein